MPKNWPWTRHLPPPTTPVEVQSVQDRLEAAQDGLVEDLEQHAHANDQASRSNVILRKLNGIMAENHIGPSIDKIIRSKNDH